MYSVKVPIYNIMMGLVQHIGNFTYKIELSPTLFKSYYNKKPVYPGMVENNILLKLTFYRKREN